MLQPSDYLHYCHLGPAPTGPCPSDIGGPRPRCSTQMENHQRRVEEQDHLPRPAGHVSSDAAQETSVSQRCKCTGPSGCLTRGGVSGSIAAWQHSPSPGEKGRSPAAMPARRCRPVSDPPLQDAPRSSASRRLRPASPRPPPRVPRGARRHPRPALPPRCVSPGGVPGAREQGSTGMVSRIPSARSSAAAPAPEHGGEPRRSTAPPGSVCHPYCRAPRRCLSRREGRLLCCSPGTCPCPAALTHWRCACVCLSMTRRVRDLREPAAWCVAFAQFMLGKAKNSNFS